MTSDTLLVISGVPGAGKSHFGRWLRSKGWRWIDNDKVASKPSKDVIEASWLGVFGVGDATERIKGFVNAARADATPTVLEFGFPVQLLPVVEAMRASGALAWWFTGDGPTCLSDWRSSWHSEMPDEIWWRQYDAITREWPAIAQVYGPNIIRTRLATRHMTAADISAVIGLIVP